eukprot:gene41849-63956_t
MTQAPTGAPTVSPAIVPTWAPAPHAAPPTAAPQLSRAARELRDGGDVAGAAAARAEIRRMCREAVPGAPADTDAPADDVTPSPTQTMGALCPAPVTRLPVSSTPVTTAEEEGHEPSPQEQPGSPASRDDRIAAVVGMVLHSADGVRVHSAEEVAARTGGLLAAQFTFHPALPAAGGPRRDCEVLLTRPPFGHWLPWGFVLDEQTLELLHCTAGSVAASSAPLCSCCGMVQPRSRGANGIP